MKSWLELTLTACKCIGEGISAFADGKEIFDHFKNKNKEEQVEPVANLDSEEKPAE